jgi:hypothetical protein
VHCLPSPAQCIVGGMKREVLNRLAGAARVLLLASLIVSPSRAAAADLKPEAASAFALYTQQAERRMNEDLRPGALFLSLDRLPDDRRRDAEAQLFRGDVVVNRLDDPGSMKAAPVAGALIHDWTGIVFIPGASLDDVLAAVEDYDRQSDFYQPEVVKSKLLRRNANDFHIYLRLQQQESFLTVTFDTEHDVHYTRLDARRAASESRSTRIVEVENAGERSERALPEGRDHGFLWALNSYWRFSEVPSGVYVQCEAISLTRDIPAGLGPLIGGYIETIAQDSLGTTLRHTRDAVLKRKSAALKQTNSVSGSRQSTQGENRHEHEPRTRNDNDGHRFTQARVPA